MSLPASSISVHSAFCDFTGSCSSYTGEIVVLTRKYFYKKRNNEVEMIRFKVVAQGSSLSDK